MPACRYKKIFLKDLASLPKGYRSRIERLVFKEIPGSGNIFLDFDIHTSKIQWKSSPSRDPMIPSQIPGICGLLSYPFRELPYRV